MKESYEEERVQVQLTKAEVEQIKKGKIIRGHKVDIGLEAGE